MTFVLATPSAFRYLSLVAQATTHLSSTRGHPESVSEVRCGEVEVRGRREEWSRREQDWRLRERREGK